MAHLGVPKKTFHCGKGKRGEGQVLLLRTSLVERSRNRWALIRTASVYLAAEKGGKKENVSSSMRPRTEEADSSAVARYASTKGKKYAVYTLPTGGGERGGTMSCCGRGKGKGIAAAEGARNKEIDAQPRHRGKGEGGGGELRHYLLGAMKVCLFRILLNEKGGIHHSAGRKKGEKNKNTYAHNVGEEAPKRSVP